MPRPKDLLINTHLVQAHYLALSAAVMLAGTSYVLQLEPPSDPAIIASPPEVIWPSYLVGALGGYLIFGSLAAARWSKPVALGLQAVGLALQGVASAVVCVTMALSSGTFPFYAQFTALIAISHAVHWFVIRRELRRVTLKTALAEEVLPLLAEKGLTPPH